MVTATKLNRRRVLLMGAAACMTSTSFALSPITPKRVRVIVVLADNENQGIVPVKPSLGDGQNPRTNLYWGALYGVKTYFKTHPEWEMFEDESIFTGAEGVLETANFRWGKAEPHIEIRAEAWAGSKMREAIGHFYALAETSINDELIVFVGHNGLMDSRVFAPIADADTRKLNVELNRSAMVLACSSSAYFSSPLEQMGVRPLLMTSGLMAPEAYSIEPAIRAWAAGEDANAVRNAGATGYSNYQKIPMRNAQRLFGAR